MLEVVKSDRYNSSIDIVWFADLSGMDFMDSIRIGEFAEAETSGRPCLSISDDAAFTNRPELLKVVH